MKKKKLKVRITELEETINKMQILVDQRNAIHARLLGEAWHRELELVQILNREKEECKKLKYLVNSQSAEKDEALAEVERLKVIINANPS